MLTPKTLAGLLAPVLVISPMLAVEPALAQSPAAFRAATAAAQFLGGARTSERVAEVARALRTGARGSLPGALDEQLRGVSEAELLEALRAVDVGTAGQLQEALASLPPPVEAAIVRAAERAATPGASGMRDRVRAANPLLDARLQLSMAEEKLGRARGREPGDPCRLELSCQVKDLLTDVEELLEAMACEDSACVTAREQLAADARRARIELEWTSLRREYEALDRVGTAMDIAASVEQCLAEGDPCGCIALLAQDGCE